MAREARPPGPPRQFFGLGLPLLQRDPLKFLSELAAEYGDVVYFRSGREHFYLLSHPDFVKDVLLTSARKFAKGRALERSKMLLGEGLLTSEGEFHLRQRKLMQPAFHRQRIAGYAEAMIEFATRSREGWQAGQEIDVHAEMTALTLAIAGKTLFDADVERDTGEVMSAITEAFSLFHLTLVPFSELLERLPFSPIRKLHRARERLDRVVYRIIAERRKSGEDRGDLLSMLLRAQDPEAGGARMSDEQLRDECLTLFLAGHETTANLLTWTWYLLALNPEIERKLRREIDEVLGRKKPVFEDIEKLTYTKMVISESLRMYPPAWIIGRRALEAHEIGGFRIPARALVAVSSWITHHDARWYPEPLRFDPERWRPDVQAARPKFSFFPFAAGPRQCIGEGFAWTEATLVLATVMQRWKMDLLPEQNIVPKPSITLRPNGPVRMVLRAG
jgi:cytochrome P450